MTKWFERGPGSEETLLALYDAVGVAEELDLAEQAREDALLAEVFVPADWLADELGESRDPDDPVELADEQVDETERITMPHAVGIIEHLLGGRPMDGGERTPG